MTISKETEKADMIVTIMTVQKKDIVNQVKDGSLLMITTITERKQVILFVIQMAA